MYRGGRRRRWVLASPPQASTRAILSTPLYHKRITIGLQLGYSLVTVLERFGYSLVPAELKRDSRASDSKHGCSAEDPWLGLAVGRLSRASCQRLAPTTKPGILLPRLEASESTSAFGVAVPVHHVVTLLSQLGYEEKRLDVSVKELAESGF